MSALRALEPFARRSRLARGGARCEICGGAHDTTHRHVVDCADRRLLCACAACAVSFGASRGRFRTVPEGARPARAEVTSDALRAAGVPVGLAFFFRASNLGRWAAVYPSPAGPTEAELSEGALQALPDLAGDVEEDVEALLVYGRRDGSSTCLVAPIDACYGLVAILRRAWKGIDGGDEAREAVERFLAGMVERCGAAGRSGEVEP